MTCGEIDGSAINYGTRTGQGT